MENPKGNLVEYLKKNLAKGYDGDTLRYALISQGHSKFEVDRAVKTAIKELEEKKKRENAEKPKEEKPEIKYEIYGDNDKPIREPLWRRVYKKYFY